MSNGSAENGSDKTTGGRPANSWTPILSAITVFIVLSAIVITISVNFRGRTDIANDPSSTATPTATASASPSDAPSSGSTSGSGSGSGSAEESPSPSASPSAD